MEGFNVSVVVPTFNRVDFVLEAIKSISSQTFQPLETILVDNNSGDNTTEMVAKHFKSVKILIQKKQGVSAARNLGIREASGNWIAFLDSDDQWHKRKLEEQVKSISRDKLSADLSHTDEIWYRNKIFLNQKEIHKKRGGFIFENCLPLTVTRFITPSGKPAAWNISMITCAEYIWVSAGFQTITLPSIAGAAQRFAQIEVKLNGVSANINPSSGLCSNLFHIPGCDSGCSL